MWSLPLEPPLITISPSVSWLSICLESAVWSFLFPTVKAEGLLPQHLSPQRALAIVVLHWLNSNCKQGWARLYYQMQLKIPEKSIMEYITTKEAKKGGAGKGLQSVAADSSYYWGGMQSCYLLMCSCSCHMSLSLDFSPLFLFFKLLFIFILSFK